MCKIWVWLAEYVMNKSITNFYSISNLIEVSLVVYAPGDGIGLVCMEFQFPRPQLMVHAIYH